MITRKKIKIFTSLICVLVLLIIIILYRTYDSPRHVIAEVNHIMNLSVPYNDITYFEKKSGGFHGDGDTISIITLTDENNSSFHDNLDDRWIKIHPKSEIYNYLWDSKTIPGKKAVGGMLNERLYPESDIVFILLDYTNMKTNEYIDFCDITDFYYVGYSYVKGKIYIQKTNL